jgi:cobalamin biosynthesis Co2+ chelatase CbiK
MDDSGGTGRAITQHVRSINGIEVEDLVAQSNSFGDSYEEWTPVGVAKMSQITISGYYDDTATTGPDVVFNQTSRPTPATSSRTLVVLFGASKSVTTECHIVKYTRTPVTDSLTGYEAVLQPTGTITEA